jgi:hypothetical protein
MNTTRLNFEAVSPQRRRLLMASVGGGAAAALPSLARATLSARTSPVGADTSADAGMSGWMLSGQVLHGPKREALAGARVEVWSASGSIDSIHTDAEGRFALSISRQEVRPENLGTLKYWVSHRDRGSFAASLGSVSPAGQGLATVHADAAGRLMAEVGITLV